jgi:hypothetical protein
MFYEVTPWFDERIRVHCESVEIYRELITWSDCEKQSVYDNPDGSSSFDVTMPKDMKARVVKFFKGK